MKRLYSFYLFLVLMLYLTGCAMNPVTGRNELALMNVSVEQEVRLGEKSYAQALQRMGGIYPDAVLNAYINRVGQRLAHTSHRPELEYHFKIVNDSSPNAFALPGGFIAITRGLLTSIENEAQLAAVLGHEIGHVTARHSIQEIQRSTLLNTSVGLLGSLAGETGYAELLTQVSSLTATLISKSYSRKQEYEADQLGVDYLARSGYSVQGAIELQNIFIQKFEDSGNSDWLNGLFRTHPFSRERLLANQEHINRSYADFYSRDGLDKNSYRQHVASLDSTREAYALYDQARKAEATGQFDSAIEIYHRAMQKAPDHGLLLTSLGMAYLRKEDMIPARRYLRKAVAIDPNYYKSRMGLGYIYLQNKQPREAANQLDVSLRLLPTIEGTFLLGEAEEAQGNLSRARQLYQAVAQADHNGRLGQAAVVHLRSLSR